jgi:type I restriction enzyme S subunit
LIETMNGYCIKPVSVPTPYRMLKLSALQPEGLDLTDTKYVRVPENIAKRFHIRKDDLLICRSVGSFDMVAKCAVATENKPDTLFPDIIIRARLKPTLLPAYVRELIQTPLGRSHFQSNARTAVGMWKIGADDIARFPIPVPPLEVQRQLVERLAAARAEIARERAAAAKLAHETAAQIEALILGVHGL